MVRGNSLLRLFVVALTGSVIAGCTASTLTAQSAAVPMAVLLVGAGALALVGALLLWRRRRTSPSHAGSAVGWSVTADGPAARDAEFALAPGAARAAAAAAPPASSDEEEPGVDAPPLSESTDPFLSESAEPFMSEGAEPLETDPVVGEPEATEPTVTPVASDDVELPVADPPPADAPTPHTEWWGEDEQPPPSLRADVPEPTWDDETEPIWDADDDAWFDEPDRDPDADDVDADDVDADDVDADDADSDDLFEPPPSWRR
jgi:hypothetical protein